MSGELQISGGSAGIGARYEDVMFHGNRLLSTAGELAGMVDDVAGLVLNDSFVASHLLCPVEAATADALVAAAIFGPGGLLPTSAAIGALGLGTIAAVNALMLLDATLAASMDALADVGGFLIGMALPGVAVVGVVVLLGNPLLTVSVYQHREALLAELQETLFEHPWMLEIIARTAPSAVQGTLSLPGLLFGPAGQPALLAAISGGRWPAGDYEDSLAGLINFMGLFGHLQNSGDFTVDKAPNDRGVPAPTSVQGVMQTQAKLGEEQRQIAITTVTGTDGVTRYIVSLPGTQEWSTKRGDNPVDMTTNVRLMGQQDSVLKEKVAEAMRQAGIPADAPVMLTGHSQGGIVAASLASDPDFRKQYNVQAVVTAGAPVGRMPIPDNISVLSVEHTQDPVAMLDGTGNPPNPKWVTVRRDAPPELADFRGGGTSPLRRPRDRPVHRHRQADRPVQRPVDPDVQELDQPVLHVWRPGPALPSRPEAVAATSVR